MTASNEKCLGNKQSDIMMWGADTCSVELNKHNSYAQRVADTLLFDCFGD